MIFLHKLPVLLVDLILLLDVHLMVVICTGLSLMGIKCMYNLLGGFLLSTGFSCILVIQNWNAALILFFFTLFVFLSCLGSNVVCYDTQFLIKLSIPPKSLNSSPNFSFLVKTDIPVRKCFLAVESAGVTNTWVDCRVEASDL